MMPKIRSVISAVCLLIFNACLKGGTTVETNATDSIEIDPEGYIVFCPCMGRFGNQADQFLGALAFAKSIRRTFVIPHWIEYIPYQSGSLQVPYAAYFDPAAINEYHKAITMDDFMDRVAPKIWPEDKRLAFCYVERGNGKGCDAKNGNPFGPFWDHFKVNFVGSEIYGPDVHYIGDAGTYDKWAKKYPGDRWPVLAFVGPPSTFPVEEKNAHLQKYVVWNDKIKSDMQTFIRSLPKGPFVGIHLRNGLDWNRACELVDGERDLFASPQCTGYGKKVAKLTKEMCLPSTELIIKQVKRAVKKINATSVFVASDKNFLTNELTKALKNLKVTVHDARSKNSPHLDLAILGQSNLFIGNCVSSFSAFVKRERDVKGFPSQFWGFPPPHKDKKKNLERNEL